MARLEEKQTRKRASNALQPRIQGQWISKSGNSPGTLVISGTAWDVILKAHTPSTTKAGRETKPVLYEEDKELSDKETSTSKAEIMPDEPQTSQNISLHSSV